VEDLDRLEALREERGRHQRAADRIRDEIHALIRRMPKSSDKRAIERAAGISRPTIYRLLDEGHPDETE
jgi:DNA invertase Pin-like site-specific DNA recombinase